MNSWSKKINDSYADRVLDSFMAHEWNRMFLGEDEELIYQNTAKIFNAINKVFDSYSSEGFSTNLLSYLTQNINERELYSTIKWNKLERDSQKVKDYIDNLKELFLELDYNDKCLFLTNSKRVMDIGDTMKREENINKFIKLRDEESQLVADLLELLFAVQIKSKDWNQSIKFSHRAYHTFHNYSDSYSDAFSDYKEGKISIEPENVRSYIRKRMRSWILTNLKSLFHTPSDINNIGSYSILSLLLELGILFSKEDNFTEYTENP